ncbi:hypothetical protein PVAG01_08305 [Phlyctema vagabunda]|uniref:Nephrocystin 3-like N-terminal domain-containing protein n=1 Tax=Phlyctema vagabunda TaxID=108571 RepID=A0ABR4P919_9HELO
MECESSVPVFWLHGIFGMGKTFLISRLLDSIEEAILENPNIQLAYFYFSEEEDRNTPEDAIQNILSQLAITPDGSIAPTIANLYDSKPTPSLSLKQSQKELAALVDDQAQTVIIIDAIDECHNYGKFLRMLKGVFPEGKSSVNLILSSSEDADIERNIKTIFPKYKSQKLTSDTNEKDIKRYVDIQVKQRETKEIGSRLLDGCCEICTKDGNAAKPKTCKEHADIEDRLTKLLVSKSGGMFKWLEFQLSLFFPRNNPIKTKEDIEEQLHKLNKMEGLPKLDEVYKQIHERNASRPEELKIAERAYKWLLYCSLPMSTTNLTDAVSMKDDGSRSNAINLRSLCCNLVEFSDKDEPAQFTHPTVRDYLERAKNQKRTRLYTEIECHKQIAKSCLAYLNNSAIPKFSNEAFEGTTWEFRTYAAVFWPFHFSEVPEVDRDDTLRDLATHFFIRKHGQTTFKPWSEAWLKIAREEALRAKSSDSGFKNKDTLFTTRFSKAYSVIVSMLTIPPDPFFAACMFGLPIVGKDSAFKEKEKFGVRNIQDELGVFLAIQSRRLNSLRILSDAGVAGLKEAWQQGNNALHWAASHGTSSMVSLLINKGADISVLNDNGATAFHLAAGSRFDAVEKILLLSQLDPNRHDAKGATVLHYAVQSPKAPCKVVAKLEELSADFKLIDLAGETPLHYAAKRSSLGVDLAEMLLPRVDVNVVSKNGKTALACLLASRSTPSLKLVNLFIAWDAKTSVTNPPDDEGTVLHYAVKNPKFPFALVKLLLNRESINSTDRLGRTALHCAMIPCHETLTTTAVRNRTNSIISLLVRSEANCNIADKNGATVLHYLARMPVQPADIMDLLLEKIKQATMAPKNRANIICAVNKLEETPLHIALTHNNMGTTTDRAAVKALIKNSKDLAAADCVGETVLHRAIRNTCTPQDIVAYLIKQGANVRTCDTTRSSPLHFVAEWGDQEMVRLLLDKGADVKSKDKDGALALHRAVARNTTSKATVITQLIGAGLDANEIDKAGRTPLHNAAQQGNKNGVEILITRFSANVLIVDKNINTVLHCAVSNATHALNVAEYLLRLKEVEVDKRNSNKETPLHVAAKAKKASPDLIRLLISKNADCLAQDVNGNTPLHIAAQKRTPSAEVIRKIVDAKREVLKVTNESGETALHLALNNRSSSEAYIALFKVGASTKAKNGKNVRAINAVTDDGKTALHHAASQGWLDAVKDLLEHGANINSTDLTNLTPLALAAISGHEHVVEVLLDAGASVDIKTKDLETPLHLAAANGHHDTVQLLLKSKAGVNEKNKSGWTPLWSAVSGRHERVARLLLNKGASIDVRTSDGRTLLHQAVTFKYASIGMARTLLANINAEDEKHTTPLFQAVQRNIKKNRLMISLLLDKDAKCLGSDQNDKMEKQPEAKLSQRDKLVDRLLAIAELNTAASKGKHSKVKEILSSSEIKDLVHARAENGKNAVLSAASEGKRTTVTLLLDKFHADVNSRTIRGNSLHHAADHDYVKVTKVLIKHEADLNVTNRFRQTPLHRAALFGSSEVAKLLIKQKETDLNATDRDSETALLTACRFEKAEVAEILLRKHGVDTLKPDSEGHTPLFWARKNKLENVEKLLLEQEPKA